MHIILCDCGIMARLLTVALLIVIISSVVLAEKIDICVRCTESSDPLSQCDSLIDKNCLTFSELIGCDEIFNGTLILRKNTTINIRLSPGLHLFNSTEYDFYISRVQSVVLTGEGATVTCLSKYTTITFAEVSSYINISGITFDSCSLEFKYFFMHTVGNLFFTSTVFIDSIITQRSNPDDMYFVRWDGLRGCESYKKLEIVNTSFINSTFSATMDLFLHEHVPMGTLCIIVALQNVMFKDIYIAAHDHSVALYLFKVHSIKLTDTTFQNVCGSSVVAEYVHAVTLRRVAFVNNRCTGSLLQLQKVYSIDYSDNCIFEYNTNSKGVIFYAVKQQTIAFNSTVEFRNNDFDEVVFSFIGQRSALNIWRGTSIFENNTAGEAIILLDHIVLSVRKGQLIFKRNRSSSPQLQLKLFRPSAIMLLQSVTASFMSSSRILFSNNAAERSGGMTSVDSEINIGTSHIVFEYNEGGDGGGMAFYKKSYIYADFSLGEVQKINTMYFSNNRAHRNGGAIFVEDSDYAEISDADSRLKYFLSTSNLIYLQFINNTAKMAGNDLYGGWIDSYGIQISSTYPQTDRHAIASDPTRICMCHDSIPVCN